MGYKSIKDPGKVTRMGGTAQRILLCPFLDFLVLAAPADGTFNITTAHTFPANSGKGFIEVYVTKDTGTVKYSPLGGPDRNSFLVEGEFYHPGESDEIESFANNAKNERWIALVPVPGIPDMFQVGDKDFQVQIEPSYDATKNSGDGRGWSFKYSCFAANKIKYKGPAVTMATEV